MSRYYSEEQLITTVSRLTRTRLTTYVKHEFICPSQSESGVVYSAADLARIELICDLDEQFDLQGDALGVVLSLIDQLHGVRGELRRVMEAIEAQPDDVQGQIIALLQKV
ncbi:MAG TPA: hypothetical protein DD729_07750 [Rhodobacteraceae bacterium]|jgi:chaperone modulatory protein CbpM|nr:hypothetical protein [Paracoccaceae bacterium]